MPQSSSTVAVPDTRTWSLTSKAGVTKTFEQSELTIDGEVRIVQLANATIQSLNKAGFPWEEVATVVDKQGDWDWAKLSGLLSLAVTEVPEFVSESACILFDISPFDEEGRRNTAYESDKLFIRKSINFAKWIEVMQTFVDQNDYERLIRPFGLALTRTLGTMTATPSRESETSSPPSTYLSTMDTEETPEASIED